MHRSKEVIFQNSKFPDRYPNPLKHNHEHTILQSRLEDRMLVVVLQRIRISIWEFTILKNYLLRSMHCEILQGSLMPQATLWLPIFMIWDPGSMEELG